jgi:hypothetical protein
VRVLNIRRGKVLLLALGAFTFAALCAFVIGSAEEAQQRIGWMGLVFFGAGGVVALVQLLPGASSLTLDAEGFTVRSLFRNRAKVRWKDVAGFGRWNVHRARVVGYNYNFGYTGKATTRALSAALGTPDGTLGDQYDTGGEDLANLMERWRNGHRS